MTSTIMSTKGQLIIPSNIREELGWGKGTKLNIQKTPFGVMVFRVSATPLKSMRGMFKGFNVSAKEIKAMRKRDEKHDQSEKSII